MAGANAIRAILLLGAIVAAACGGTGTQAPTATKRAGLIAFTRQHRSQRDQIYVVDTNGSVERPLTAGTDDALEPVWSPDGSRIAFLGHNDELFVMNADGTHRRLVTRGAGWIRGADRPTWSPDGRRLVFAADLDALAHALYTVNADGTGLRRLHRASGTDPAWSPDGKVIAFSADEGGIALMRVTDGRTRDLTDGSCDTFPTWSPDGTQIAYNFTPGPTCLSAASEIHVVGADGDDDRALTHPPNGLYDQAAAWSPDGERIVFTRGDFAYGDIYVIDAAGGAATQLTETRLHRDFDPSWQALPARSG
jgi:TolB protein